MQNTFQVSTKLVQSHQHGKPSVSQHFNHYHPEQILLVRAVKGQLLGMKCFPCIWEVH